jgi:DNA polymerase III gamma/tau subunit
MSPQLLEIMHVSKFILILDITGMRHIKFILIMDLNSIRAQVVLHRIDILQEVPTIYDQDKDVFKLDRLKLLANSLKAEEVQLYYQISINGLKDLPYASDLKSGFEMVILRMIEFNPARVAPVNFYNHKIELSEIDS